MKSFNIIIVLSCAWNVAAAFAGETTPWEQRFAALEATIGASPCVKVAKPTQVEPGTPGVWEIRVDACTLKAGQALAFALKPDYGKSTRVRVYTQEQGSSDQAIAAPSLPSDISARPEFVRQMLEAATVGNPYVKATYVRPADELSVARTVLQFYPGLIKVGEIEDTRPAVFGMVFAKRYGGQPPNGVEVIFNYGPINQ